MTQFTAQTEVVLGKLTAITSFAAQPSLAKLFENIERQCLLDFGNVPPDALTILIQRTA